VSPVPSAARAGGLLGDRALSLRLDDGVLHLGEQVFRLGQLEPQGGRGQLVPLGGQHVPRHRRLAAIVVGVDGELHG
jgi:streptogramin lyase